MAAVIDRIPVTHGVVQDLATHSDALLDKSGQDGSEGVSVAVLSSSSAAPDLWSTHHEGRERETMTIQQRCTLSFVFPCTGSASSQGQKLSSRSPQSQMIQLPVANTVFQNGRTSNLLAQRWILQHRNDAESKLMLDRKAFLPQQTLHIVDLLAAKNMHLHQSLRSSLAQITPARAVTAAMGNIIRKIRVGGSSEENTPASKELEKAISSGIRRGTVPAQPAGVWALVKPREHTARNESESIEPKIDFDLLENAIFSGCRLHKVLSGGGGWGEKQGLLALDPDSDYISRQQECQSGLGVEPDVEVEEFQALGEVVKPGDIVTFYIYNPSLVLKSATDSPPCISASESLASLSLMFGSLPSTMDAMPDPIGTGNAASMQSNCAMIRNHFGMLSEQGMSLNVGVLS